MLAAKGFEAFGSAARFVKAGFGRPPGRPPGHVPGGGIGQQARSALSRLFSGAAHTPLPETSVNGFSVGAASRRPVNIRSGLSLPVRHALGRPLGTPFYMARAPAVPRSTMQVGLGTARRFSTARPIFQSLVENVPVTGRALWEVDWDLRVREEAKLRIRKSGENKPTKTAETAKPKESAKEQFDFYFAEPTNTDVKTVLRLPLAPTPTGRLPLAASGSAVLPLETLSTMHADHESHRLRVSALFDKLDKASVWDHGATIRALGDPSGLATVLEVSFEGWTQERVKSMLGGAESGWCSVEELPGVSEEAIATLSSSELVFPKLDVSAAEMFEDPRVENVSSPVPPHSRSQELFDIPTPSEHDSGWIRWDMVQDYPASDEYLSENDGWSSGMSTPGSLEAWSIPSTPAPVVMPLDDVRDSWMFSADFARRAGSGEELFF